MSSMTTIVTKGRMIALAALAALVLAGPARAATTPSDAWITTKVKLALLTTEGVSVTDVNVDTVARQVTLHGTVGTAAEKEVAERTAKAVQGAETVRNLLQVVPAKNEAAVEVKDDEVSKRVSAALAAEPSLMTSSISVQSVHNGVVLLGGNATSLSDHLTAVEIARDVKGVRRVASEVQSPDALGDADIWKEPTFAAGGGTARSARNAINDLYITSMVKLRLLSDSETPAMDINVDTRSGVVTLFGIVPTAESKAAAESDATKVNGVASVRNQLQVVASARQPAVEAKDDVIQSDVKKNLEQRADLAGVNAEVKNCVVRLTGTVSSGIERVEALQVARATKGVCSVKDDLTLK